MFMAFLFSVLGDGLNALGSKASFGRYLGIAGIFSWFAIALYNITQDSFATPNIWVNFGILVGMTAFTLGSEKNSLHAPTSPGFDAKRLNQRRPAPDSE